MNAKANPNVGYEKQLTAMGAPLDNLKQVLGETLPVMDVPEGEIIV